MTAFDQAFIKAFSQQQSRTNVAAPAPPADPTPAGAGAVAPAAVQTESVAPRPTVARKPAEPAASTPKPSTFGDVLAALERPPKERVASEFRDGAPQRPISTPRNHVIGNAASPCDAHSPVMTPPVRSKLQPPACRSSVADQPWVATSECCTAIAEPIRDESWAIGTEAWTEASQPWTAAVPQAVAETAPPVVETPATSWAEQESTPQTRTIEPPVATREPKDCAAPQEQRQASVRVPVSPAVSPPRIFSPEPTAASEFRPAWQVDHFTWPRVCRRLIGLAPEELDRLADALMSANADGQKVLAVAGCHRGDGATTLLLCAARRLAERGVKAVLVDADRARPRLGKRLGIDSQHGWNETSPEGELNLDQAVVEAVANNLSVATLLDPSDNPAAAAADESTLAACIETLRQHYEMVVVDPGPLDALESIRESLASTSEGKIDAVLLVQNHRATSDEDIEDTEQRLTSAGVAVAGIVENFVVS